MEETRKPPVTKARAEAAVRWALGDFFDQEQFDIGFREGQRQIRSGDRKAATLPAR